MASLQRTEDNIATLTRINITKVVGRSVALVLKRNNYECILFDDGCVDCLSVDAMEVYLVL
jgi:hypothetical protein